MDTFTDLERENLEKIFQAFDYNNEGLIGKEDLESILGQLHSSKSMDMNSVRLLMDDFSTGTPDKFTFEEFIELIHRLEQSDLIQSSPAKEDGEVTGTEKLLDVLKLLEDYRKECQELGKYAEANRAKAKHDELKRKEITRQLKAIRSAQEADLKKLEESHQQQFQEFSAAWDVYMADYESTAYSSLEKLKEKHMLEYQEFHEKVMREARSKMKPSKELLGLRQKEQVLAKQKMYHEAEEIKDKADRLEEWERSKNESVVQEISNNREKKIKKEQQQALAALMRRIQRDRDEQVKHRKEDSERLLQRNKNIRNDLIAKQNQDAKKLIEEIRRVFGLNTHDIKYQTKTGSFKLGKTKVSASRFEESK